MARDASPESNFLLFGMSVLVGTGVFAAVGFVSSDFRLIQPSSGQLVLAMALGVGAFFGYPVLGSIVVATLESYRSWAYLRDAQPWSSSDKAIRGAFCFPFLLWGLVVYTFFAIVHRWFRDSASNPRL